VWTDLTGGLIDAQLLTAAAALESCTSAEYTEAFDSLEQLLGRLRPYGRSSGELRRGQFD
jgi:hypothetical protein